MCSAAWRVPGEPRPAVVVRSARCACPSRGSRRYARALFENRIPVLTDEQLEAQVVARLDRQRMLSERPTVPFHFIVEEVVFRRRPVGRDVWCRQLDYVPERTALAT